MISDFFLDFFVDKNLSRVLSFIIFFVPVQELGDNWPQSCDFL